MLPPRTIAAGLVLALAAAGCSSGPKQPQARPGVTGATAVAGVRLKLTGAEVVSPARALAPLDPPTSRLVLAAVQRTFDATVVRSLTSGKGGSIDADFTTDAKAHAIFPDRGAMYDEGLPAVSRVVADKAEVHLTALAGDDDAPALIVAKIDWSVRSPDRRVRVRHVGELSLIPAFGKWLIGAYTVLVSRTVAGATTTTSATTG